MVGWLLQVGAGLSDGNGTGLPLPAIGKDYAVRRIWLAENNSEEDGRLATQDMKQ